MADIKCRESNFTGNQPIKLLISGTTGKMVVRVGPLYSVQFSPEEIIELRRFINDHYS